ncbi:MAG: sugar ABC transporter ATP-binding protein [Smithellaceae bacterium]
MEPLLVEMQGITKAFPGVLALEQVDLTVRKGEILGLIGENGAGKSTLMKILTGVYQADAGAITYKGERFALKEPGDAYRNGISIIFQEFNLCPNLSAMENIFLGKEIAFKGTGFINAKKARTEAEQFFRRLKIEIDPDAEVRKLGVAQQQMIEIAKALSYDTQLLIMDEPTSSLASAEVENLFEIVRDLQTHGIAVVFISHKLDEMLAITDRIAVLRDGKNAGELPTADATKDQLITLMVGRELTHFFSQRKAAPSQEVTFEVQHLSGLPNTKDVSFQLHKGEILGLAGLVGAGRTELAKLLIGAAPKTDGVTILHNREVRIDNPEIAVDHGIAYLPEDRKNLGLILPMTTQENLSMSIHKKLRKLLHFIDHRKETAICQTYVDRLQIKVASLAQVVKHLSGGNQQKVVIGKWLATAPSVFILDEPTRGIDVGAKAEVHRIIAELADEGVPILLISSELHEIMGLSDRILVMHDGRITANLSRADADQETIMKAAVN